MCNKTKKYSSQTNHVADYIFSLSNSEKISLNLRRNNASIFLQHTNVSTLNIWGEFKPVVSKKAIKEAKRNTKQQNTNFASEVHTSGTTAPKPSLKQQKSSRKKQAKEPKFIRPSEKNDNIDVRKSRKSLIKRARAKYYTQLLIRPLVNWAEKNNSPLYKQYKNILSCNSTLIQKEDSIHGSYCSNKACQVCSRIRTARMIDAYEMPLKELEIDYDGLDFVTLTVKNVKGELLKPTIRKMVKEFTLINRWMREKLKLPTAGIRQLEVTYNSRTNEYHPHFHIVCPSGQGQIIYDEWLYRFPTSHKKGQHVAKWDGNLKELFKYATKIIDTTSKPKKEFAKGEFKSNIQIDEEGKKIIPVNLKALDTILCSLTGIRVTQPFGELYNIAINENLNAVNVGQDYRDLPEIPQPAPCKMLVVTDNGTLEEQWIDKPPKPLVKWHWLNNDWYFEGCLDIELCGYASNQNLKYKFYSK